jgi:hypothetical protein
MLNAGARANERRNAARRKNKGGNQAIRDAVEQSDGGAGSTGTEGRVRAGLSRRSDKRNVGWSGVQPRLDGDVLCGVGRKIQEQGGWATSKK